MKKIIVLLMVMLLIIGLFGCRPAERVAYNISKEADTVHSARRIGKVAPYIVDRITIIKTGIGIQAQPLIQPDIVTSEFKGITFAIEDVGKDVFLTLAEAEKALADRGVTE